MSDFVQVVPLILVLFSAGYFLVNKFWPGRRWLLVFLFAFLLRIAVSFFLRSAFLFDDEISFHESGAAQLYGLVSYYPERMYHNIVAILYSLFGENILLGKLFNAFLGTISAFLALSIARRTLDSEKAARCAMLLVAFLPPTIIYSSLNLKGAGTIFLFLFLILITIRPGSRPWKKLTEIALTLIVLYWFRGLIWTALSIFALSAYWLMQYREHLRRYAKHVRLAIEGQLLHFTEFVAAVAFNEYGRLVFAWEKAIYHLDFNLYVYSISSNATVSQFLVPGSQLNPVNLIVLSLRALYSPSPFSPLFDRSGGDFIEAITSLTWYLLAPFALLGTILWLRKLTPARLFLLSLMAGMALFAVVGDTGRYRTILLPLILILTAGGFHARHDRLFKPISYIWWLSVILFTTLWVTLRITRL